MKIAPGNRVEQIRARYAHYGDRVPANTAVADIRALLAAVEVRDAVLARLGQCIIIVPQQRTHGDGT